MGSVSRFREGGYFVEGFNVDSEIKKSSAEGGDGR